jgi:hypothetical protein
VDISSNDHQLTDQAVKKVQLHAAISNVVKMMLIKHTFSYPTPTIMPMMLFLVANAYTKGI